MFDISVNGVDPGGERPPEELVYDADGERVELVRARSSNADLEVRVYQASGDHHKHFYGTFEDAIAQFGAHVAARQAVEA